MFNTVKKIANNVKEIFSIPTVDENGNIISNELGGLHPVDLKLQVTDVTQTPHTSYGEIKLAAMQELLEVCNDDDLDAVLRLTINVLKARGFTCIPGDVDAIMYDLWKQSEMVGK
jgi:hypothetical protein